VIKKNIKCTLANYWTLKRGGPFSVEHGRSGKLRWGKNAVEGKWLPIQKGVHHGEGGQDARGVKTKQGTGRSVAKGKSVCHHLEKTNA